MRWFGTARTRTGIIVDDVLLYVTGGFAFANIRHDFTVNDPGIPATESFSTKAGRWGWTAGLGSEWAWSQSVSIKSEVLYVKFSEVTTTGFSPAGNQTVTFDSNDSMWVSLIGINVKLGGY